MSYCELCGREEIIFPSGRYDRKTGNPIAKSRCPNQKCENGCDHDRYFFWRMKCPDCGYVPQDY